MSNQDIETPETVDTVETTDNDDNNSASGTDTNLAKNGLWNGPRKNVGIKIDVGLYKAFKPIAQARFGSVCCAVEGFMAGIVGAVHNSKVSMGNTVTIDGGMHVHRTGLKERRKYVVDVDENEAKLIEDRDMMVAHYVKMGESPSASKVAGSLATIYELSTRVSVEDRILLKDMIMRELTRLGK